MPAGFAGGGSGGRGGGWLQACLGRSAGVPSNTKRPGVGFGTSRRTWGRQTAARDREEEQQAELRGPHVAPTQPVRPGKEAATMPASLASLRQRH